MKNPVFRTFLAGMEKKDERYLMNETKAMQCRAGDRVIRQGTRDRAIFIVVQGMFMTLGEEQTVYRPGAVLGAKQFLHGDPWDLDLISQGDDGVIGKLSYNSYAQLKESQPATAVRFYNRIIRSMTYELIYARKNNIEYYHQNLERQIDGLGLTDEDLMVDLKLGNSKAIHNLYMANTQNDLKISKGKLQLTLTKGYNEECLDNFTRPEDNYREGDGILRRPRDEAGPLKGSNLGGRTLDSRGSLAKQATTLGAGESLAKK